MAQKQTDAAIRRRLEEERAALQAEIEALPIDIQGQQDDNGGGQHPADYATDLYLRERNIPLRSNAQDLLDRIDSALERLDAGSYGICERCGKQINPERMEALPYATMCVECQRLADAEQ